MFPECIECRGVRGMCGIDPCPLLAEVRRQLPTMPSLRIEVLSGPSPPSLFVGRFGYPKVTAGPMASALSSSEDEPVAPADPAEMFGQPLEVVAGRHVNLVRGRHEVGVKDASRPDKVLQTTQELALAARNVDVEMEFTNPVYIGSAPNFDSLSRPLGPTGEVRKAVLTSHPVVPRKVDSVAEETDLLASVAINELSNDGIGEAHLTRLLSAGILGVEERRRMVPTRWAITATDDMLGKQAWERVRDLPTIDKVEVYEATYLDNRFKVILTPGSWAFHMLECWMQGSLWGESEILGDHEEGKPRTSYASRVTGAYYSARLAVFEHLEARGRSGAALIWRDIGSGYWAPVGVWLIRETMREAMKQTPKVFDTLAEAVEHIAPNVAKPDDLRNCWFVTRTRQTRIDEWRIDEPS